MDREGQTHICLAEDDQALNHLLRKRLTRMGHRVSSCASGAELIAALQADPPDLLISDYNLGDMTFARVQETVPAIGTAIPFVIMTGQSDVHIAVEVMKRGARDYMIKDESLLTSLPVNLERVLKEIQRDLRLQQAEADLKTFAERQATLLREVNHRTKNNMLAMCSLLQMEADRVTEGEPIQPRQLVQDIRTRLESLSTVHSLLSRQDWQPLNAAELCRQILQSVFEGAADQTVRLAVSPCEVTVTSDQAHNLGLVLNELATNTLKYARAGAEDLAVTVAIRQEEDLVSLRYRDSGAGFPEEVLKRSSKSGIGLELIYGITSSSLQGEATLANDGGACTTLRFPAAGPPPVTVQPSRTPPDGAVEERPASAQGDPIPLSREQYHTLFECLPYRMFIKDTDSIYTWCSEQFASVFNSTPALLIGRSDYDFFPSELAEKYRRDDRRVLESGEPLELIEPFAMNSTTRYAHTLKTVIRNERGQTVGIFGMFRDVTDEHRTRLEAEQARRDLVEAKEKAEALIRLVPTAVFTVDTEQRITDWNQEAERITGYTRDQALGQPCSFFTLDPCTRICGLYTDSIPKPAIGKQCTIRRKDGAERAILKNCDLVRDIDGKAVGGVECFIDITERQANEDALVASKGQLEAALAEQNAILRESAAHNEAIHEAAPMGIAVYRADGQCRMANRHAGEIIGATVEQMEAQNFHTIESWKKTGLRDAAVAALESRERQRLEIHTVTTFGREVWLDCRFTPFATRQGPALLLVFDDVTERRMAEERERALNAAQADLLKEVNHRVNNNLASLISMLHMQQNRWNEKDVHTHDALIQELIGRIESLSTVHTMLTNSGWQPLTISDIAERIVQATLNHTPPAQAISHSITGDSVPVSSECAHYLAMALHELTSNTIHHGCTDHSDRHIAIHIDYNEEREVTLTYSDNGAGFPESILAMPDLQQGIGLTLIQGLITHSLRGQVTLANDNGARVILQFPYNRQPGSPS